MIFNTALATYLGLLFAVFALIFNHKVQVPIKYLNCVSWPQVCLLMFVFCKNCFDSMSVVSALR